MDIMNEITQAFPDYSISVETIRDTKMPNVVSNQLYINGVPARISWSAKLGEDISYSLKESADEMLLDMLIYEISKTIGLNENANR